MCSCSLTQILTNQRPSKCSNAHISTILKTFENVLPWTWPPGEIGDEEGLGVGQTQGFGVDRRKGPLGGTFLSHWGAEEEA